jgi:two-component system, LuxR family, sensor histidine kinase DctS
MSIHHLGAIAAKSAVLRGLFFRVFRRPANALASIFARQGVWLPVTAFVLLFLAALLLMVWLSLNYETNRRQTQLELDVIDAAAAIQSVLLRDAQTFQLQGLGAVGTSEFLTATPRLLVERPEILLLERRVLVRHSRDIPEEVVSAWGNHPAAKALSAVPRLAPEAAIARDLVSLHGAAIFSGTYFVAAPEGGGAELFELWVAENGTEKPSAIVRVVYSLSALLDQRITPVLQRRHEVTLTDPDNTLIARLNNGVRGANVYGAKARIDLPSMTLVLRANSADRSPDLIPNLASGLVVLLGSGFVISLLFLIRDARRREAAEAEVRAQNQLRKAMEDSLVTGLRARDMQGIVTYVNPAFCEMVGYAENELIGRPPPMPYWAPEARAEYERRFSQVLAGTVTRKGYETVFMRRNGERFPAIIYESPLVGDNGEQTGWMASIVDISEQRRIEDINRQQQEKLHTSTRLATLGEIATVLSHELNQPLAAISTYAAAASAMMVAPTPDESRDSDEQAELHYTLTQIEKQAQRAGTIVRRVHDFMRVRQVVTEPLDLLLVVQELMPLIELQARRLWVRTEIVTKLESAPVRAERIMIEQVVMNLTRNAVEAMATTREDLRHLKILLEQSQSEQGRPLFKVTIVDSGPGVPESIANNLFGLFVSSKSQGMGIGLNISRSVVEASGGQLWHEPRLQEGKVVGSLFCFVLPRDQTT